MVLLEVKNVTKKFGGLTAVNDVSLKVSEKKITGLIGPNGAGKTTLFNLITGFETLTSGQIFFNNQEITNQPPHQLVNRRLVRTFQITRLFNKMSVLENVMAGMYSLTHAGTVSSMLGLPSVRKEEEMVREKATELLKEVGIDKLAAVPAGNLATGQKRLLEIARALAVKPTLLMLDEPAAGLNTAETESLLVLIKKINKDGITVFVIEHNMKFMMRLADHIYVLEFGKHIAEGPPDAIINNQRVVNAYLGKEYRHA